MGGAIVIVLALGLCLLKAMALRRERRIRTGAPLTPVERLWEQQSRGRADMRARQWHEANDWRKGPRPGEEAF